MKVELEPEQEQIIAGLIRQGRFSTPSEVVSASLGLIQAEEAWRKYAQERIDVGIRALRADDFAPENAVDQLYDRYQSKSA